MRSIIDNIQKTSFKSNFDEFTLRKCPSNLGSSLIDDSITPNLGGFEMKLSDIENGASNLQNSTMGGGSNQERIYTSHAQNRKKLIDQNFVLSEAQIQSISRKQNEKSQSILNYKYISNDHTEPTSCSMLKGHKLKTNKSQARTRASHHLFSAKSTQKNQAYRYQRSRVGDYFNCNKLYKKDKINSFIDSFSQNLNNSKKLNNNRKEFNHQLLQSGRQFGNFKSIELANNIQNNLNIKSNSIKPIKQFVHEKFVKMESPISVGQRRNVHQPKIMALDSQQSEFIETNEQQPSKEEYVTPNLDLGQSLELNEKENFEIGHYIHNPLNQQLEMQINTNQMYRFNFIKNQTQMRNSPDSMIPISQNTHQASPKIKHDRENNVSRSNNQTISGDISPQINRQRFFRPIRQKWKAKIKTKADYEKLENNKQIGNCNDLQHDNAKKNSQNLHKDRSIGSMKLKYSQALKSHLRLSSQDWNKLTIQANQRSIVRRRNFSKSMAVSNWQSKRNSSTMEINNMSNSFLDQLNSSIVTGGSRYDQNGFELMNHNVISEGPDNRVNTYQNMNLTDFFEKNDDDQVILTPQSFQLPLKQKFKDIVDKYNFNKDIRLDELRNIQKSCQQNQKDFNSIGTCVQTVNSSKQFGSDQASHSAIRKILSPSQPNSHIKVTFNETKSSNENTNQILPTFNCMLFDQNVVEKQEILLLKLTELQKLKIQQLEQLKDKSSTRQSRGNSECFNIQMNEFPDIQRALQAQTLELEVKDLEDNLNNIKITNQIDNKIFDSRQPSPKIQGKSEGEPFPHKNLTPPKKLDMNIITNRNSKSNSISVNYSNPQTLKHQSTLQRNYNQSPQEMLKLKQKSISPSFNSVERSPFDIDSKYKIFKMNETDEEFEQSPTFEKIIDSESTRQINLRMNKVSENVQESYQVEMMHKSLENKSNTIDNRGKNSSIHLHDSIETNNDQFYQLRKFSKEVKIENEGSMDDQSINLRHLQYKTQGMRQANTPLDLKSKCKKKFDNMDIQIQYLDKQQTQEKDRGNSSQSIHRKRDVKINTEQQEKEIVCDKIQSLIQYSQKKHNMKFSEFIQILMKCKNISNLNSSQMMSKYLNDAKLRELFDLFVSSGDNSRLNNQDIDQVIDLKNSEATPVNKINKKKMVNKQKSVHLQAIDAMHKEMKIDTQKKLNHFNRQEYEEIRMKNIQQLDDINIINQIYNISNLIQQRLSNPSQYQDIDEYISANKINKLFDQIKSTDTLDHIAPSPGQNCFGKKSNEERSSNMKNSKSLSSFSTQANNLRHIFSNFNQTLKKSEEKLRRKSNLSRKPQMLNNDTHKSFNQIIKSNQSPIKIKSKKSNNGSPEIKQLEVIPQETSLTFANVNKKKSGRKLDIHVYSGININQDVICQNEVPHYTIIERNSSKDITKQMNQKNLIEIQVNNEESEDKKRNQSPNRSIVFEKYNTRMNNRNQNQNLMKLTTLQFKERNVSENNVSNQIEISDRSVKNPPSTININKAMESIRIEEEKTFNKHMTTKISNRLSERNNNNFIGNGKHDIETLQSVSAKTPNNFTFSKNDLKQHLSKQKTLNNIIKQQKINIVSDIIQNQLKILQIENDLKEIKSQRLPIKGNEQGKTKNIVNIEDQNEMGRINQSSLRRKFNSNRGHQTMQAIKNNFRTKPCTSKRSEQGYQRNPYRLFDFLRDKKKNFENSVLQSI